MGAMATRCNSARPRMVHTLFFLQMGTPKNTQVVAVKDFELYNKDPENDLHVIQKLWDLFQEADVVIGHNSDAFDIKKANSRFAYHNLGPTSHYQSVDTLKIARRHFKFNSNKLGHLGETLRTRCKRIHWRIQLMGRVHERRR